jgi:hypothetical protein
MQQGGYQTLLVYADRERFANLAFLTGYEPRFEEALLVLPVDGTGLLLVGNEGYGYARSVAALAYFDLGLCPTFSLYGQPRDITSKGRTLEAWLRPFILPGAKVGVVGTKSFTSAETMEPERRFDVPSLTIDTARDLTGFNNVFNASDLLIHPSNGFRTGGFTTTAADIARFEFASEVSYSGVRSLLRGLRPGMSEWEASALLGFAGTPPLAYHVALGFGENHVNAGLGSPDPFNRLQVGDPVTFGFGVWGGNIARTGFGVSEQSELPEASVRYVEDLCEPYLRCLKDWYEAHTLDATGGSVYQKVRWFVEDTRYAVGLNPGHLIHLDEWPATPYAPDATERLRSGMFIQCDIIPAPGAPLYGIHTEDGIALADEALRKELEEQFPRVAKRIKQRRETVCNHIGIQLPEEVLPLSSMQACVAPFLLDAEAVLAI